MMTEQIQSHWLQDIYRIQNGTILTVNKFIYNGVILRDMRDVTKTEKIKGIKNCYRALEDFEHWGKKRLKGTISLNTYMILPLNYSTDYTYKITNNDSISGECKEIVEILNEIKRTIKNYQ